MQQISEFGQTPKQLFTEPHCRRRTGPAVPAAPPALRRPTHAAGAGSGRREGEAGQGRAGAGGWGVCALEQAALDQAAAVVMGASPARANRAQGWGNDEDDIDAQGEAGPGASYMRPLVEGSDSDVEPRNWTAHVGARVSPPPPPQLRAPPPRPRLACGWLCACVAQGVRLCLAALSCVTSCGCLAAPTPPSVRG